MIRFTALIDLWVIKIKKTYDTAHVAGQDQVNIAQNAVYTARIYKSFVYSISIVTITRLHDYQTWQTVLGK